MTATIHPAPTPPVVPRVGAWLALLLLLVPAFCFLLWLRPYSKLARAGWGLWLGLILFVKVTGMADPVLKIDLPRGEGAPATESAELPLNEFVAKLLGAWAMASFSVDGPTVTLIYRRQDGALDKPEVLADLGISNGYSLLYRRDFQTVILRIPGAEGWKQMRLTRQDFRDFFGLDDAALAGASHSDGRRGPPPIDGLTPADKARFVTRYLR